MSRRRPFRRFVVPVSAVVLALACSGGVGTVTPTAPVLSTTAPPTAEPVPASVAPGPAGEVLAAAELDEPTLDGRVWRIRYRSTTLAGEPVAVTGLVARPAGDAPPDGFPVLSWAHGTTGVADTCAPSIHGSAAVFGLQQMLDAGYVVAATDYEGLGGPGVHPYLVADSEGRSVLDAVRAARDLVPATSGQVVVVGVSQGGHAALAAAQIAHEWAPELHLVGIVAAAPAADVERIARAAFVPDFPAFGFAPLIVAGWADTYEDLSAADVLGPDGLALVDVAVGGACVGEVLSASGDETGEDLLARSPFELEAWRRRLTENSIQAARVRGPVLLVQGTADDIIPAALSDQLHEQLCAAGVAVRYSRYEGAGHGEAAFLAFGEIRRWAADRLEGRPADTTCP